MTRGFEVRRDAEQRLLDHAPPQHAETLRLELSFYFYAHQLTPQPLQRGLDPWVRRRLHDEAPERLLPPLQAIRRLLEAGVRSPGFDLSANVEAARRDGHPHADRVALL
ncbi:hypothetical protein L6R49_10060, partial [Myxococcota bacterium]|nr:hypothetical protein [Myxococcota bacterium]